MSIFKNLRLRSPFTFADAAEDTDQLSYGRQAFAGMSAEDIPDTNPDSVIAKKGIGVYREMLQRDEQVRASIYFKILARLSTGYEITEGDDGDPEKRDFVAYVHEQMSGSPNHLIKMILDALGMGFSAIEKIWGTPYEDGPFAGKIGFRKYHPLMQEYTELKSNRWGELEEDGVWQHNPLDLYGTDRPNRGNYVAHPTKDFIVYSHNKVADNYHGESDLRAAYRYYVLKDVTYRSWGYYLETFGQPFLWAEDAGGPSSNRSETLTVLEKMRKFGAAVFPRGTKINMQLPNGDSSRENFSKLIEKCDRGIARACLLPSLLMEHGDVGSYALGESHTDQFVWILEDLGETIEETLCEQWIRPLIDMNWSKTDVYPRLKFNNFKRDDLQILMEIVEKLSNKGLPVGKRWAGEKFGIPEPADDEEVLSQGAALVPSPDPGTLGLAPPGEGAAPASPDDENVQEKQLEKAGWEISGVMAGANGKAPVVFATRKRWREPTKAEIQCDFDQIEDQADKSISEAGGNIALILDLTRQRAVDLMTRGDPKLPFVRRT